MQAVMAVTRTGANATEASAAAVPVRPGNEATYSQALAIKARAAWPFSGTDANCSCVGSGNPACVYRQTATSCTVWVYSKAIAGYVRSNTANNTCYCPTTSYPTWE